MDAQHGDILIVEDDNVIRESLCELLVEEGYQVSTACHGREALTWLRQGHRPCVIVLDLMMPIMDGWQLLEVLRQDTALADLAVVVVSASRQAREPAGTVRFLKKPINLEVLLTELASRCCRDKPLSANPP